MFVFLQNWRARSFLRSPFRSCCSARSQCSTSLGFSINTLTLFGLVLAVGLLVDDAIVVVENVERLIHEEPGA